LKSDCLGSEESEVGLLKESDASIYVGTDYPKIIAVGHRSAG